MTFRITHGDNSSIYAQVDITVRKKNDSGDEAEHFHHVETAVDSSTMPTFEGDAGTVGPELSEGTSGPDPIPGAYTAYATFYKEGNDPLKYACATTQ